MLEGKRFDRLVAVKRAEPKIMPSGKKQQQWHCKCDCGAETIVAHSSLQGGLTRSCGCKKLEAAKANLAKAQAWVEENGNSRTLQLTGEVFGRLTVTGLNRMENGSSYWDCLCECGTSVVVKGGQLNFGGTRSCGCLQLEVAAANCRKRVGSISEKRRQATRDKYEGQRFGKAVVNSIEYMPKALALCSCDCGNNFSCVPGDLSTGQQASCGCAGSGRSAEEKRLVDWLSQFVPVLSDTKLAPGDSQRFDVICPGQKLAVEFNGVYWHSIEHKDKHYHKEKRELAEKHGYSLISIWQDDWAFREDQIKALLLRRLGVGDVTHVGARKLAVVDVDHKVANALHTKHHLQSAVPVGSIHTGLVLDGELIAVATFKQEKKQLNLTRYTVVGGYSIAGGLTKIISAVRKAGHTLPIVTYADRDYFTGGLYTAAGFESQGESLQLTYFANGSRKRRERYMKNRLAAMGMPPKEGETEIETLRRHKIHACYNSGIEKFCLG